MSRSDISIYRFHISEEQPASASCPPVDVCFEAALSAAIGIESALVALKAIYLRRAHTQQLSSKELKNTFCVFLGLNLFESPSE